MNGDDGLLGREMTSWNRRGIETQVCDFFVTTSWVVPKTNLYHIFTGFKYICKPGPFDNLNGPHSCPQECSSCRSKLSHPSRARQEWDSGTAYY